MFTFTLPLIFTLYFYFHFLAVACSDSPSILHICHHCFATPKTFPFKGLESLKFENVDAFNLWSILPL